MLEYIKTGNPILQAMLSEFDTVPFQPMIQTNDS